MKNFKRKVSALVLSTLFASMQVSYAAGLSDAAINKIEGGYAGQVAGNGSLFLVKHHICVRRVVIHVSIEFHLCAVFKRIT